MCRSKKQMRREDRRFGLPSAGRIPKSPRMTPDQRHSLIKKILFLLVLLSTGTGAWLYQKPKKSVGVQIPINKPEVKEAPASRVAAVPLRIVHHQLRDDPASKQLGENVDRIQKKYGNQVIVRHEEIQPVKPEKGKTPPTHVVMFLGNQKVFEFQGLWTFTKLEYKVEELLYRIARVDKDWRPAVPGMTPTPR
jgi:hypothetical protein